MNGTPPRIEIFAPFGAAFELTKKILFRPFNFTKWLIIGFAAFLSHLAGGAANFNPGSRGWRNSNWDVHSSTSSAADAIHNVPGWVIPLVAIGILLFLVLAGVLIWVGSRGKFIFTDCIVRDRGAIQGPWHEYRREGNSLFAFTLLIALLFIGVILLGGLPLLIPIMAHGSDLVIGAGFVAGLVLLVLVVLVLATAWGLISQFMVPIMYRRRCTASEAFRIATRLIGQHLGMFVLYFLFMIVLALGTAMIGCLATCVTCCIAAIPYVGTVILLPIYVLLAAYPLLFLRQFGPDFDVWAAVAPVETLPPTQPFSSSPPPAPPTEPPIIS